jgi:electron transfer flavoprotein alpha subunit
MIQSLVLLEHDGGRVAPSSLRALSLARRLGGPYALLILGARVASVAESVRAYGAEVVLLADHRALVEPLADRCATVVAQAARHLGASRILATSSTFAKDILPRAAALLDAPMVTDVVAVETDEAGPVYSRPVSAGAFIARVRLEGALHVLTARSSAFEVPVSNCRSCPVEMLTVDGSQLSNGTEFVCRERPVSTRPDLAEARVVVAGGRGLKDREAFERLIGGLADKLGGAVGATRAAVDAGLAPNNCQIGQTGRNVAPELYIGIGISGAIQHLAGIKDSKVIVAVNRDAEAPICQIATYTLVGDLNEIVPRLATALGS